MPRLDNAIEIKAPAEAVFQYVTDVNHYPEWVKWVKEAERTSEAGGLGATDAIRMQVGPRKQNVEAIVTEYKENETQTRQHTRGMQMTDRISIVPMGNDTTKVAWSVEYTPPMGAIGKLMDLIMMETLFDQLMKDSMTRLQERLEGAG